MTRVVILGHLVVKSSGKIHLKEKHFPLEPSKLWLVHFSQSSFTLTYKLGPTRSNMTRKGSTLVSYISVGMSLPLLFGQTLKNIHNKSLLPSFP